MRRSNLTHKLPRTIYFTVRGIFLIELTHGEVAHIQSLPSPQSNHFSLLFDLIRVHLLFPVAELMETIPTRQPPLLSNENINSSVHKLPL